MKGTALLIDTNVVLDWLMKRQPFNNEATKIIALCIKRDVTGYLACHSIPNILYIVRKDFGVEKRKEIGLMLCYRFNIIGIDRQIIIKALQNKNWDDLEDGLQMQCAIVEKIDYIITRDQSGFESSAVQAISPEAFLKLYERMQES